MRSRLALKPALVNFPEDNTALVIFEATILAFCLNRYAFGLEDLEGYCAPAALADDVAADVPKDSFSLPADAEA